MALKITMGLLLAAGVGWIFHQRWQIESDGPRPSRWLNRTSLLVEPLLIPFYLVFLFAVYAFSDVQFAGTFLLVSCAVLVPYISIYYALLLVLLPLLRRWISPRACAALWLLPNLLYLTIFIVNTDQTPLFVLTLPRPWLTVLAVIWAAGFVVVQVGQILSHLLFRRQLLKDALPVEDPAILSQWKLEQDRRLVRRRTIPILVSSRTSTPVTVGFFLDRMRLVLPHTNYTEEELTLIFRHELRHMERQDVHTKAFLGFCVALCWFNPLVWIARRKACDDLELSCDELVLTYADEYERKQYANLLLNTAGSSRGYTTCLSAGAAALRYRLKSIVRTRKRLSGAVVVGIALFGLILGNGTMALADSPDSADALVFDRLPTDSIVENVRLKKDWEGRGYYGIRNFHGWDEAALTDYLSSLSLKEVYLGSSYSAANDRRELALELAARTWWGETTSTTTIWLWDDMLRVSTYGEERTQSVYFLQEELDWDYIESLLDPYAPAIEIAEPPELYISFGDERRITTTRSIATTLSMERSGVTYPVNAPAKEPFVIDRSEYPTDTVRLGFSYDPSANVEVLVENWDRTESYTVTSPAPTDTELKLAPYAAHYTVYGRFATVEDTVYEMKFSFDVK